MKVRKVIDAPKQASQEQEEWNPPSIDWKIPVPLCAYVPPTKRFKLPNVTVEDGQYVHNNCIQDICPCKEAKRYAAITPERIWRHDLRDT